MEILRDWWAVIVAALTAAIGYYTGQLKNSWQISLLMKQVERLDTRVGHLEKQGSDVSVSLAQINTSLAQITATLSEIKEEMRHKVDK